MCDRIRWTRMQPVRELTCNPLDRDEQAQLRPQEIERINRLLGQMAEAADEVNCLFRQARRRLVAALNRQADRADQSDEAL